MASKNPPTSKKRMIFFAFAVLIFAAGYFLAPTQMQNGSYTASIILNSQTVMKFSFDVVAEQANATMQTIQFSGVYDIAVHVQKEFLAELGGKIHFTLQFFSDGKLSNSEIVHDLSAEVIGSKFAMTLSPMITGEYVEFSMTILQHSNFTLGLLFAISFLWLSEIIPLSAASLAIPVLVVGLKIDSTANSLSPFFSNVIVLFFAGFLMAEAMKKTGLDKIIALNILARVPPSGKILILTMMIISAVFSMFMSNTAAAAVLIPLAISILDSMKEQNMEYRKTLILSIAYSATLGGVGSIIGTPPNVLATDLLNEYNGTSINFVQWFLFGLPIVVFMLPLIFLYLIIRFKPKIDKDELKEARDTAISELKQQHNLSVDQIVVGTIFTSIVLLWLTTQWHGVSAGIVALFGAVALFFTGQLNEKDLNKLNWNVLLTFGGGLALGNLILKTGLAEWIASKLTILHNFPPILLLFCLGLLALILTAIASNTASAAILIPIVMPLGLVLGFNPAVLAIYVAIISSVDFAIIIGTPPTMMAYSTNYFEVKEIFTIGVVVDFIGLLIVTLLSWLYFSQALRIII